jgi:hypothetical protein
MILLTHPEVMRTWMNVIGTLKPAFASTVLLLQLISLVF